MSSVRAPRSLRAQSRISFPRLTVRRGVVLLGAAVILLAGWLYVRSSSLVGIRQVQVTGVAGAQAGEIRTTLRNEALAMTTLNVSTAKLESSLASYPHIAGLRVSTHFPHGVTIAVNEQIPVATVTSDGRQVAVDGDGLLLRREATAGLPKLPIAAESSANRVTAAGTRATLSVLAAAPYELLSHIQSARATERHGITVQLRNGPDVYFGDTGQLSSKWSSAVAVLASSDSAGASYIDVSAPDRPAAGSGST